MLGPSSPGSKTSPRLFLALSAAAFDGTLSPLVKKLRINADREGFDFRWVPAELRHVTLLFLGATPLERLDDLRERITAVAGRQPPLTLKVAGLGAFPDDRSGRVIWAGVQNSRALRGLRDNLRAALEPDFGSFGEEYQPHLTLGRMRNPQSVRDYLSPFVRTKIGKMTMSEFVLFESIARPPFPVYRERARFMLTGAPAADEDEAALAD